MLGLGLTLGVAFPLTSLTLEAWGSSSTVVGLSGAVSPLAILLVVPALPRVVGRLGAIRSMVLGCVVALLAIAWMYLVQTAAAWIAGRFVIGAGLALPWLVGDIWVNSVASDSNRGKVILAYVVSLFVGFAVGPLLLDAVGIEGWPPHALTVGALAVAVFPLVVFRGIAPVIEVAHDSRLRTTIRKAPRVAVGAFASGFTEGIAFSLTPI